MFKLTFVIFIYNMPKYKTLNEETRGSWFYSQNSKDNIMMCSIIIIDYVVIILSFNDRSVLSLEKSTAIVCAVHIYSTSGITKVKACLSMLL